MSVQHDTCSPEPERCIKLSPETGHYIKTRYRRVTDLYFIREAE